MLTLLWYGVPAPIITATCDPQDYNFLIQLDTRPGAPIVETSPGVWEVVGSIPGQVKPKTLKMIIGASLLSAQH